MTKKQRPEALAKFAQSAREKNKAHAGHASGKDELTADRHTKPIPTDPDKKQDAATRVLREGATGKDHGSDEVIDKLPDRIRESR